MKAKEVIGELRNVGLLKDKVLARIGDKTLGVTDLHVNKYGVYLIASEEATEYSVLMIGELLKIMIKKLFYGRLDQTVMLGEMYGDSDDRRMRTHEIGHVEYNDGVFVIFAEDER